MRRRSLSQRRTSCRLSQSGPPRPHPKGASLEKFDNPVRVVVDGGGADDGSLRFKVQGSRFPVLKFPVLRFRVLRFKLRNRIFRTLKGLLLSKIPENQRMRTVNREP